MDIKTEVKKLHDSKTHMPMRYGYYTTSAHSSSGGCFYGIVDSIYSAKNTGGQVYAVFHGDGAPLTFEALKDNAVFNKELMAWTQPFNIFKGTDRTLIWLSFLLSPRSPWKALLPFLVEDSPEYINNAGFIFKDVKNIPAKLLYNFVTAFRFPWEMPRAFGLWLLLRKELGDTQAFWLTQHFTLHKSAETINGPYDIIYPWSCLEETGFDTYARFITGTPKTLRADCEVTPHTVHSLWPIGLKAPEDYAQSLFDAAVKEPVLKLPDLRNMMDNLFESQRAYL